MSDPATWNPDWIGLDGPPLDDLAEHAPALPVLAALRRAALTAANGPAVPSFDDLARWAQSPDPALDDAVAYWSVRSELIASAAEEAVAEEAALAPTELAAAGLSRRRDDLLAYAALVREPFPAIYRGAGWVVVLGLDPSGLLYLALEGAPGAIPTADLHLPDLGLAVPLPPTVGSFTQVGAVDTLFAGDPEYNPVRTVQVRIGATPVASLERDTP